MIRITCSRNWTRPDAFERLEADWGIGATAQRLAPAWADDATACTRNGSPIPREDWDRVLADGDSLFFYQRPGIALAVSPALFAFLSTVAPVWNAIVVGVLASVVSRLLLPSKKPTKPGDQGSSTWGFTNLQRNARIEGTGIPVGVGRHRTAPPIINQYTVTRLDEDGNPVSELRTLMLLSEGPCQAVGDKTADGGPFSKEAGNQIKTLQINHQPATNYEDVETWVRLGSNEQTAIDEFADPVIQATVDQTLRFPEDMISAVGDNASDPPGSTNSPSALTAIATTGSFPASDANITKWDTVGGSKQVSFTMGEEAEEFTLLLGLPQGLIDLSGASPAPNTVVYQVRYQQVDELGVAFGNVVVLDSQRVTLQRTGTFATEFRRRFLTPAIYAPTTFGFFLRSRAAAQANPGVGYTIDSTNIPQVAPADLKFSFATWIRRRNAQTVGTTNRLLQWFDVAGNEGFRVNITRDSTLLTSVQVQFGTGAGIQSPSQSALHWSILSTDTTNFHHLAVTYEAKFDGTNARTRIYLDGVLMFTDIRNAMAVIDMGQQIRLCSDSETVPTLGFDGHMDETTLWSRVLTAYDVTALYGGGTPQATLDAAESLIIGARFDTHLSTGLDHTSAFGPGLNGAASPAGWKLGSGNDTATDPEVSIRPTQVLGTVRTLEGGTPLKGRYRIDVMRINAEDEVNGVLSELSLLIVQLRTFQKYQFPGCTLLAVKARASDQLKGGDPLFTVVGDWLLMPVWDGVDPVHPNIVDTWTRNPAWIALGILTNKRWGLGGLFTIADVDLPAFDDLADYCDELIYDNDARETLVTARQLEASDTATDPNMAIVAEDAVRYRFDRLPSNFPAPTGGKVATGRYITIKQFGTPSPAAPAWAVAQVAAGPQEVIYVTHDTTTGDFYVYCKSAAAVVTSSALFVPSVSGTDYFAGEMHAQRYFFDGVFDQAGTKAWDAAIQVLQVARASPVRIGSRVSVFCDKPSQPVALIGMGSIIAGTWRSNVQGIRGRHNTEEAEFFDENFDYERRPVRDELPDVTDPTKASTSHTRRIKLEGIVRRGQAKRHLRRDLNTLNLARRMVGWEMGYDALPFTPGNVVDLSHDVPGYGASGRVIETAVSGTTIKLDREVVIESGKSYQVQLEHAASDTRETKPITTAAGTYAAGTALTVGSGGFATPAEEEDEYAFGEVGASTKSYRIVESTLNPQTFRRRLRAIEYVEAVYDDDFGTFETATITNLPVPNAPLIPPGVENLVVTEETTRGPDGAVLIGAQVSFSHYPETFAGVEGTDVFVSTGEDASSRAGAELVTRLDATTTTCRISYPFERDRAYTILIVPRAHGGASLGRSFVSFQIFRPSGLARTPRPPANLRAAVAGELVAFEWDDDDGALDHGATVEFRRGGWVLGLRVASVPAQARSTPPLSDWATGPANAHGVTEPDTIVRVKLRTGQYSEAVTLKHAPAVASADGTVLAMSDEDFW